MDIVKRLRGDYGVPVPFTTTPICHEAADEIERLRQQNERMKETLQNIASVLDDENSDYQKWALYCGDIASLCLEDIAEATGGE